MRREHAGPYALHNRLQHDPTPSNVLSLRTRGGGSGGPSQWTTPGHEDQPKGYLFNQTPPPDAIVAAVSCTHVADLYVLPQSNLLIYASICLLSPSVALSIGAYQSHGKVCSAFVQLIEVHPSFLEPHLRNVIEYMLQVNKDNDYEVALEACEFWPSVGIYYFVIDGVELSVTYDIGEEELVVVLWLVVLKVLLSNMVYADDDESLLDAEEDESVPDRDQDIKPRFHSSRFQGSDGVEEEWDLASDKQMMQEEQPLQVWLTRSVNQVARCTKIINPNSDDAKYFINVKQIAKFVVGLGNKVSPTDVEEGRHVRVDRNKYQIQIPLPPKIDPIFHGGQELTATDHVIIGCPRTEGEEGDERGGDRERTIGEETVGTSPGCEIGEDRKCDGIEGEPKIELGAEGCGVGMMGTEKVINEEEDGGEVECVKLE
ncbi:hypothetical protein FNV43_RR05886 [Rhamnella rubrinervis]|uniref:26S proteasome regulatory subunit 7-like OB domain-containing protein n=1 Tax=Rhamnella rubrinervis TaxID=2594499 RepID=A0A8K0HC03_9ROSA|nr:hypothetical protein FNV43_RR05886 [Rhamnella rubrinervis]